MKHVETVMDNMHELSRDELGIAPHTIRYKEIIIKKREEICAAHREMIFKDECDEWI